VVTGLAFGLPIQRSLERVRQLVLLAEERDLRQVPAAALHMNAVRLMTVHCIKGLEFQAVHLPGPTKVSNPWIGRSDCAAAPPRHRMNRETESLDEKETGSSHRHERAQNSLHTTRFCRESVFRSHKKRGVRLIIQYRVDDSVVYSALISQGRYIFDGCNSVGSGCVLEASDFRRCTGPLGRLKQTVLLQQIHNFRVNKSK
jgi:hypothetical protein